MLRVAFLLAAAAAHAQQLPITGLGHVGFLTSDLDKARQFYTGVLGYEQAFDLKDDTGRIRLVFFKVNDEQFLEIFPGLKPGQNERMNHVAFVTPDIEKLHAMLTDRGLQPSKINKGQDGNLNCSIKDPGGLRLEFTQYLPGSLQSDLRGKLTG